MKHILASVMIFLGGASLPATGQSFSDGLNAYNAERRDTSPPPGPISDPREMIAQELIEDCALFNGTMSFGDGFQTEQDLDGDGRPEMLIDMDAARCDAAASLFCGSAGCPMTIFQKLPEGSYRKVFQSHVRGIETKTQTIIYMDFHGAWCNKDGSAPCRKAFVLEDDRIKPLGQE